MEMFACAGRSVGTDDKYARTILEAVRCWEKKSQASKILETDSLVMVNVLKETWGSFIGDCRNGWGDQEAYTQSTYHYSAYITNLQII